jgi:AcrR family transcriptional regulator
MELPDKREVSPKIRGLVETAKGLFSRYGIKRVSIEEVCREAGVSKMTFYRHFPNKAALAQHIIGAIYAEEMKRIGDIMAMDIPFEEKLKKSLIAKIEFSNRYGKEFIWELAAISDPEVRSYVEEKSMRSHDIKGMLSIAQRNGDIRADINIEFIAYMFNLMRQSFKDENLQKLYPDFGSFMKEAFNFLLYGILARSNEAKK